MGVLADLGVTLPVLAAPMAGGPTTAALVVAAATAGSLGFVAGGYKTPEALSDQLAAVRTGTDRYGVNLFAPHPVLVAPEAYLLYRESVLHLADHYGVTLPEAPLQDDDGWRDKIDLLLASPPPVVSFTFGLPDPASLAALQRAGILVVQTVTSVDEARQASDAGVDWLAVQGSAAGGHSGTFTPHLSAAAVPLTDLVAQVRRATDLPLVAAGGIADPAAAADAMTAGAIAVMVGTVLLLAPEAGTTSAHRAALVDPARGDTVITSAFTGRPARALPNAFIDTYGERAPLGYPALHHLTSPIRRAAAAVADPDNVNLWAGTGYRSAPADPVATTLRHLAGDPADVR